MTSHDTEMKRYYRDRAQVYDRIYSYPERQQDLRFLEDYIPRQFSGLQVLEIAAGTGYWSQFINPVAASLLATDATAEALAQIEKRDLAQPIATQVLDAYKLSDLSTRFSGLFSGLWLSHIPRQQLPAFVRSLNGILHPGATVLFIDNSAAQCERLPITYTDQQGNSFQNRVLDDGSVHQVLKNFPSENELMQLTQTIGYNHRYMALEHFWLFQYQIA